MSNQKTKMIDGVLYYAQRPKNCWRCVFYKNKKVGCTLGKEYCYYLAEVVKTPQEKKCEGCCYTNGEPCVSATCYKDLDAWLKERQAGRSGKKEGAANG